MTNHSDTHADPFFPWRNYSYPGDFAIDPLLQDGSASGGYMGLDDPASGSQSGWDGQVDGMQLDGTALSGGHVGDMGTANGLTPEDEHHLYDQTQPDNFNQWSSSAHPGPVRLPPHINRVTGGRVSFHNNVQFISSDLHSLILK